MNTLSPVLNRFAWGLYKHHQKLRVLISRDWFSINPSAASYWSELHAVVLPPDVLLTGGLTSRPLIIRHEIDHAGSTNRARMSGNFAGKMQAIDWSGKDLPSEISDTPTLEETSIRVRDFHHAS